MSRPPADAPFEAVGGAEAAGVARRTGGAPAATAWLTAALTAAFKAAFDAPEVAGFASLALFIAGGAGNARRSTPDCFQDARKISFAQMSQFLNS